MKAWIAIALATVGVVALIPRPSARRAEPVPVSIPAPKMEVPEEVEVITLDAELEEKRRGALEREMGIQRLKADYEERVDRLVESIDWSRAESRVRFPVEIERIRTEVEAALALLRLAD